MRRAPIRTTSKGDIIRAYIYAHINPETGEVIYVGQGQKGRAWECKKRSEPHEKFLDNLAGMGFTPADWVVILDQDIDANAVGPRELFLIKTLKPLFNHQGVVPSTAQGEASTNSVLTTAQVREIRKSYSQGGVTMQTLGEAYGVARVTILKIIHRQMWKHVD